MLLGVMQRMGVDKLLGDHEDRSLNDDELVAAHVDLLLKEGERPKDRNRHSLQNPVKPVTLRARKQKPCTKVHHLVLNCPYKFP